MQREREWLDVKHVYSNSSQAFEPLAEEAPVRDGTVEPQLLCQSADSWPGRCGCHMFQQTKTFIRKDTFTAYERVGAVDRLRRNARWPHIQHLKDAPLRVEFRF